MVKAALSGRQRGLPVLPKSLVRTVNPAQKGHFSDIFHAKTSQKEHTISRKPLSLKHLTNYRENRLFEAKRTFDGFQTILAKVFVK
ncbi:hypothetical protein [Prevotella dentasini]|uniref:hypothetical protein n=1 Tax=Prevotella dentasini TaxID=589537 RepID=UPI0011DCC643|nr:hypothetical protein [Prevotella dentasini]